jgi:hypothetical protein
VFGSSHIATLNHLTDDYELSTMLFINMLIFEELTLLLFKFRGAVECWNQATTRQCHQTRHPESEPSRIRVLEGAYRNSFETNLGSF